VLDSHVHDRQISITVHETKYWDLSFTPANYTTLQSPLQSLGPASCSTYSDCSHQYELQHTRNHYISLTISKPCLTPHSNTTIRKPLPSHTSASVGAMGANSTDLNARRSRWQHSLKCQACGAQLVEELYQEWPGSYGMQGLDMGGRR
jgi:hypothetical protein